VEKLGSEILFFINNLKEDHNAGGTSTCIIGV
jgi:hypothetical protein